MAVAFILGLYLGALVNALVDDLIMPIVSLAMPGGGDKFPIVCVWPQPIFYNLPFSKPILIYHIGVSPSPVGTRSLVIVYIYCSPWFTGHEESTPTVSFLVITCNVMQ